MNNNQIVQVADNEIIQQLVLNGDLSRMSGEQKVLYYKQFCESLGLNPLTQPFQIINFQGKQKLYATKDATEQLRKLHGVSITDLTVSNLGDIYVVTAKAVDKNGKQDAATGAVNIKGLTGDNLANAIMRCETKSKRRVTLSICGLGMLDESEIETMPGAITTDIQSEQEPKHTTIPGHWYAKLDRCKLKEDVDALAIAHKETLNANPALKAEFINKKKSLSK